MPKRLRIEGARDGKAVALPQGLDAIDIVTEVGRIQIDLGHQVPNMVLVRSSAHEGGPTAILASSCRPWTAAVSPPASLRPNPFHQPAECGLF